MRPLALRVLLLVLGSSMALAILCWLIATQSWRDYWVEIAYRRADAFAERIVETHPDLWSTYARDPSRFGETLRQFVLFEPEKLVKGNDEFKVAADKLLEILGGQLKTLKTRRSDW